MNRDLSKTYQTKELVTDKTQPIPKMDIFKDTQVDLAESNEQMTKATLNKDLMTTHVNSSALTLNQQE